MLSLPNILGRAVVVAALTLVFAPGAHAATITVTTGADHSAPPSACTLRDAITAANLNQPEDGCTTGSGTEGDIIVLGARMLGRDGPATGDDDNTNGDLDVTSTIELVGAGVSRTTIDAQHIDRAIHVLVGGNLALRGLTVTGGRSAVGGAGGDGANGGGILNEGTLEVLSSRVSGNATGNGGGAPGGAGGDGGSGGGIFSSGSVSVAASVVATNQTGDGGDGDDGGDGGDGGGIAGTGFVNLDTSTVSGNGTGSGAPGGAGGSAGLGGDGGGLAMAEDDVRTIQNSTIASNHAAGSGGGVSSAVGDLTLSYSTLAANTRGPASISSDLSAPSGSARVDDSILGACTLGALVQDQGGNIGTNGSCPGVAGDPRLGPLRDNGGPTPTMALGQGSAAIDHISASGGCRWPTDQRGFKRPSGPGCDAGAFEVQQPPPPAVAAAGPDETAPGASQVAVVPATFAVGTASTPLNGTAAARTRRSVGRGTTISYRLTEPAEALLSIELRTKGLDFRRSRRAKARCLKATRKNRRVLIKRLRRRLGRRAAGRSGRRRLSRLVRRARCALYVPQVVLKRTSRAGVNKVAFSGRIRKRALRRGRYHVVILATDAADNRSKAARASFRIVAAK